MNDFPLMGMAQIVKKYGDDSFPSVVFEMSQLGRNRDSEEGRAGTILSTIHSAKGQEYDEVTIDADVAENISAAAKSGFQQHGEEINVAYVGFTRAVKRLHLPSAFQSLLSNRWKNHIRGYLGKSPTGSMRSAGSLEMGAQVFRRKPRAVDNSALQREEKEREGWPSLRVADKVRTLLGPGKIVEIAGEKCLIDLENQSARLWEDMPRLAPTS